MSNTPVRSAIHNRAQLGMEVTAGTTVDATIRLSSGDLRWQPDIPINDFRPEGWRYGIASPVQKEMAMADIVESPINFNDVVYWLSSIMHVAAVPGTWLFQHDNFNPQEIQTYTIERGTGTSGERVGFAVCDALNFRWAKEQAVMSGHLFGQKMATGVTMATSGVTETGKALAIPGKNTIKIGTTIGGLTKIAKGVLEANFGLTGAYNPNFYLDEAEPSYSDIRAEAPSISAGLTVKNNSAAWGYLNNLRASDLLFASISSFGALGPNAGANPYELTITFPFQFVQSQFNNTNGLETVNLTMTPRYDETEENFIIEVINLMATL